MSRRLQPPVETPLLRSSSSPGKHRLAYHPKTVTRVIRRVQALTMQLVPVAVEEHLITCPDSSIITPSAVSSFRRIAGDFSSCVPFALLQARHHFQNNAHQNPSDFEENMCRATACEVLARIVVARLDLMEQYEVLSARFTIIESDGDESFPLSALEAAVDGHATLFLSSNECQRCVFALWEGHLVQKIDEDDRISYSPYKPDKERFGLLARWNPERIGVPRYQHWFRLFLWLVYLASFTISIQTPARGIGPEDIMLWIQTAGYMLEDLVRLYKIGFAAIGFWSLWNWVTYSLVVIAFGYRMADVFTHDIAKSDHYRLLSFQFLSTAAPLIWAKLVTVAELYAFFGTLQIVIWRMLKESALFFAMLGILGMGFIQALTGLDVDRNTNTLGGVVNDLIQALLGSPMFDHYAKGTPTYPFGLVLYYSWSSLVLIVLLNILIALFGSAYSDCIEESMPTFMAFFAGKTISNIRAPDSFVFVAPFNLIEIFIVPFEFILSPRAFTRLNRVVMSVVFVVPLTAIALFETRLHPSSYHLVSELEADEYSTEDEEPEPWRESDDMGEGELEDKTISAVSWTELKKGVTRDGVRSVAAGQDSEERALSAEIQRLMERLDRYEKSRSGGQTRE